MLFMHFKRENKKPGRLNHLDSTKMYVMQDALSLEITK